MPVQEHRYLPMFYVVRGKQTTFLMRRWLLRVRKRAVRVPDMQQFDHVLSGRHLPRFKLPQSSQRGQVGDRDVFCSRLGLNSGNGIADGTAPPQCEFGQQSRLGVFCMQSIFFFIAGVATERYRWDSSPVAQEADRERV